MSLNLIEQLLAQPPEYDARRDQQLSEQGIVNRRNASFQLINTALGTRFKEIRNFYGLTLVQVAESLDISFAQLSKHERGLNRIPAASICILAHKLGIPVEEFFAIDDILGPIEIALKSVREDVEVAEYYDELHRPKDSDGIIPVLPEGHDSDL